MSLGKYSSASLKGDSRKVGSPGPHIGVLSLCFDKKPNRINLGRGWASGLIIQGHSVVGGKSQWQELEASGLIAPAVKKKRSKCGCSVQSLLFTQSGVLSVNARS